MKISRLIEYHRGVRITATVTTLKPAGRFEVVDLQERRIVGFQEKPTNDVGWINRGYFDLEQVDSSGPSETAILRLDPSKTVEHLVWRPRLGPETAIECTAEWYKERKRDPARGRELVHRDIAEFEALP